MRRLFSSSTQSQHWSLFLLRIQACMMSDLIFNSLSCSGKLPFYLTVNIYRIAGVTSGTTEHLTISQSKELQGKARGGREETSEIP